MKDSEKATEIKKAAKEYVTSQVKNWNGSVHKVTQKDIKTAIRKVEKALLEVRHA